MGQKMFVYLNRCLNLFLLVVTLSSADNLWKQFRSRTRHIECWSWSGSKLLVLWKNFLKTFVMKKSEQRTSLKNYPAFSIQRVRVILCEMILSYRLANIIFIELSKTIQKLFLYLIFKKFCIKCQHIAEVSGNLERQVNQETGLLFSLDYQYRRLLRQSYSYPRG